MRNIYARHTWLVTGGYDASLDGAYPRKQITCTKCHEVRRIGCALTDCRLRYGCRRRLLPRHYTRGDLVVRGDYLDQLIEYVDADNAVTWNAGGHSHLSNIADLTPYRP